MTLRLSTLEFRLSTLDFFLFRPQQAGCWLVWDTRFGSLGCVDKHVIPFSLKKDIQKKLASGGAVLYLTGREKNTLRSILLVQSR